MKENFNVYQQKQHIQLKTPILFNIADNRDCHIL